MAWSCEPRSRLMVLFSGTSTQHLAKKEVPARERGGPIPKCNGDAYLSKTRIANTREIICNRCSLRARREASRSLMLTTSGNNILDTRILSGWRVAVCHECERPRGRVVRNCLTDEGGPFGTGLQERDPKHLRRLWLERHGRVRRRKRPGGDQVRCQARRGLQRNHR